ncbi:MAG: 1-(5-phosphoribosyl)-5-[(5-phosphoribosylamino)methylideneamino]imidazole-4-carboxamide isomerase [Candidatus Omnitrophica bacterium]|nr:1-(5-phosphoribosyl)-5-[(5-phosphoribosylamino)methylideneamino]imidazole-4-carboxamide isomerase [Candidatus Omnitrophota bacterium]
MRGHVFSSFRSSVIMNLYPAIDLYEGQVVRLTRGDYLQKTIYSNNPGDIAQGWEKQGAKWLHIVDLEGAKEGILKNKSSVAAIRKVVSCKLQFGGGLRSLEQIQEMMDLGVNRVVLGTKALDQKFFEMVLNKFGTAVAVGLDVRNGMVQTQGWLKDGGESLEFSIQHFNQYPLGTIIYTDIQKDGMLQGPNFESLQSVLKLSKAPVILSGGIGQLEDVRKCTQIRESHFDGVIIGKALYDKKFTLAEALMI